MAAPPSEMVASPGVRQAQARYRRWMLDDALPVWAEVGRDQPGFGFREHLTLEGTADAVAFKRMRVQARQIYVFSHADLLGFRGGAAAAADALRFITAHGQRDDGAWVRVLGRHGGVLDPAADLYDIAFVLFGLAWFARATGERAPLHQARRTVQWVRKFMVAPFGGFHNVLPPEPGHRQQNPHMHLLEAALALFEVSQDAYYADLAHELVGLFRTRFHHRDSGTLGEFFDDALNPAAGEAGTHVEPGHHYEWVWLLDQYERLLGVPVEAEIASLYRFADAFGRDATGAAVLDVLGRDGVPRRQSIRLWPQTEALKAHVTMVRRGHPVGPSVEAALHNIMDGHLNGAPRGMWREHLSSPAGSNLVLRTPASSLYHLFLAYAEAQGFVGDETALLLN